MKKIDLAQAITILANVGVISGIVFLAIELRQNNELLSAQARVARLEVQTDFDSVLLQNGEISEIVARANAGEELTDAEKLRLRWLGRRLLTAFQFVYGEYQRGVIDASAISASDWRRAFYDFPGTDEAWAVYRDGLNPTFVHWMEENVVVER